MNIHLFHINDVHSQLENYMRLGKQLRSLRQRHTQAGEWTLTFDIGDTLDRVRPETEATFGEVNAALMSALGCDGWVFGNNEGLTIPVQRWANLAARAQVPVLGTNIRQPDGTPFPFFADTWIYEREGVRLGVFGVTPNFEGPYGVLGVQVRDPFACAAAAVAQLRQAGCDIVVALSHLGLHQDQALAREVPGIDVILGGHTHQFMTEPVFVGSTAIFQPGKHGVVFGHTVIDYDVQRRSIRQVHSEPVAVNLHGPLDTQMLSAYRGYLPDIESSLSRCVARLSEPLSVAFDRESWFGNLLVDILFQRYPCDLGIMMAGALTASLLKGEVQLQHVLGACTTPTRPIRLTLQGRDLIQALEASIQPETYHRPGFGFGFRGAVVGVLAVANAEIVLERAMGGACRIAAVKVAGQRVDPNRWYRVVTCEYLWLSPVFPAFHRGRNIEFHQPLVRDLLLEGLADAALLQQARVPRYSYLR